MQCTHPPHRIYSWLVPYDVELDGELIDTTIVCAACCDCGASLLGTAPATDEEFYDQLITAAERTRRARRATNRKGKR
jgi:hypothetical protein